jgi:hypothetical protein
MTLTALIVKLQVMFAQHGDQEVYASDSEDGVYSVTQVCRSNKAETLWARDGWSAAHAEADHDLRQIEDGILLK